MERDAAVASFLFLTILSSPINIHVCALSSKVPLSHQTRHARLEQSGGVSISGGYDPRVWTAAVAQRHQNGASDSL